MKIYIQNLRLIEPNNTTIIIFVMKWELIFLLFKIVGIRVGNVYNTIE